jgi:hypothetical protein
VTVLLFRAAPTWVLSVCSKGAAVQSLQPSGHIAHCEGCYAGAFTGREEHVLLFGLLETGSADADTYSGWLEGRADKFALSCWLDDTPDRFRFPLPLRWRWR